MRRISRRRHDALAELYGRHSKRLRATIDGVVHEEGEADDVLQEIFIQVWEEADRYSPKAGKPLGWMVTIARRRAIDRLRRRQAYSRARDRYEERVVQESQTPRRDAAEGPVLNDLRKFLKKSIRALPLLQREAVELAFFNGSKPQRNRCCHTGPSWDREDAVGTRHAKTDSRTQAITPQGVSRRRSIAAFARHTIVPVSPVASEAELPARQSTERRPAH